MSAGRPLQFDPDLARTAAMEVFWRKGYEATSLQDLLAAMGLSKSSFYQAFGSKHQLFGECLEHFRVRQVRQMTKRLSAAPSAMQFLRGFLLSVADEARRRDAPKGCLIMNTATEFAGRDPLIAGLVADGTRDFAAVFESAIRRGQGEGEIPAAKNPQALSRYFVATVSGLRAMVKAGADARAVEEIADVALDALR